MSAGISISDSSVGPATPYVPGRSGTGGSSTGTRRRPAETWTRVTFRPSALYGIYCPYGTARVVTRYWRDGRTPVVESATCGIRPPASIATPATPAAPPTAGAPPAITVTSGQVLDLVPLPTADVGVNPQVRGLVGLDTHLWWPGRTSVRVTVMLGGATVTANARAVRFVWSTGEGATYTSTRSGTEAAPAATHVYDRHGDYTLAVAITWAGTFTATLPNGVTTGPQPLGPVTTRHSRAYPVIEAQAVRER